MKIYQVPNLINYPADFVCDSQETIDAAPDYIKPFCVTGGETQANELLLVNQTAILDKASGSFVVNLEVAVEGGVKWYPVDLTTEQPNTTSIYHVFNPISGQYLDAVTGLEPAKILLEQTKQNYLVFVKADKYIILDSWNPAPPN